ncbi:MAG: hypothetical protein JSV05_00885 [Candidatus Bathyarchaeota archaeon]|nr:MAG: hypothetical protein JSV05_00885 [Candidatus Bathyarchaeota archaeon]
MTTEPENDESKPPEKLLIDDVSDFKFHAAYLAYSDAYDKTANLETKKQLNQHIVALKQEQIDSSTFYRNISQYREGRQNSRYDRAQIRTQKKREWRRKAQKQERNKRYKR